MLKLSVSLLEALWSEIVNNMLDMEHSPENTSFIRGILARYKLY